MAYPHNPFNWLLELVFPYRCLVCGKYLDKKYLCSKCFNALPVKRQSECVGCKQPTPDGRTCAFCKEQNPLDQLLIVSDYGDPNVAAVIKRMKYGFIKDLLDPLHELTRKYLNQRAKNGKSFLTGDPLPVPVPLHYRRENWRGFNQAQILAEKLANTYQIKYVAALARTTHREPQAEIENREKRLENARGLYACVAAGVVAGRNIVLIDDVCTTGATLNECARVLKDSGARSVSALVLARG